MDISMEMTEKMPVKADGAIYRIIKDEALIILPSRGQIKVLNETGSSIWEMIDGSRSIDEIIGEMKALYSDVNEDVLAGDVLEFIRELEEKEMIVFPESNTKK